MYASPGVYYERVDATGPSISAVRTDIAGFVGLARRGPCDVPVPLGSWRQAEAWFGGFTGSGYLAYTLRAFFENGGRRCWAVRVASREAAGGVATASTTLFDTAGAPTWRVAASSPGVWGNDLTVVVSEVASGQTTIPAGPARPDASLVTNTTGIRRGTLARLRQDDRIVYRVVSDVDAAAHSIVWVHPDPARRLPYDAPVVGFDPDRPISVRSVEYTLTVRERGRLVAQATGLSLIPEHPSYGPAVAAGRVPKIGTAGEPVLPDAPTVITVEELRDLDSWRLASAAQLVPLAVAARTSLLAIVDAVRLRVASIGGIARGTQLELVDPVAPEARIGPPLRVAWADGSAGNLVTLAGDGLTPLQEGAHAAAVAAGRRLTIRSLARGPVELFLGGGADGMAALTADDFIGSDADPNDADVEAVTRLRGIAALDQVDEIGIVAVPDILIRPVPPAAMSPLPPCCEPEPCAVEAPPEPVTRSPAVGDLPPVFSDDDVARVQVALVRQCERRRDRFALIDPTFGSATDPSLGVPEALSRRRQFDTSFAAFLYPWLRVADPIRSTGDATRAIPPSGHVAGQYARTDIEVGVHRAPANAAMAWVQDVTAILDAGTQELVDEGGIDLVRGLGARGIRLMGARTMSSDADLRYVNVRRLLIMIEKALALSTRWAAFEPNDTSTRLKLTISAASFLLALWQRGALTGETAAEAFYVRCDETNNPPDERANGRLLMEIGVAPTRPFEFIVMRVGRVGNEFEVLDGADRGGGNWHS